MFSTAKSNLKPFQVSRQCESPVLNPIKTTHVHPIPRERCDNAVPSVTTPVLSSAHPKTSVSRQPVVSSDSDGSFEECKFGQEKWSKSFCPFLSLYIYDNFL